MAINRDAHGSGEEPRLSLTHRVQNSIGNIRWVLTATLRSLIFEMPVKPAKTIAPSSTHEIRHAFFPYARYTSVVGVHTSLVAFTALFLPQTSLLLWPSLAESGRPQSQFQDALTYNPVMTLAWIVTGLVVLQVWWAGWIRQWCFEYSSRGGTSDEIKMDRYQFDLGRFSVCLLICVLNVSYSSRD